MSIKIEHCHVSLAAYPDKLNSNITIVNRSGLFIFRWGI